MIRWTARVVAIAALLLLGAIGGLWLYRSGALTLPMPRLTEAQVQQTVVTTIQREVPAAFLVTGQLDVTAVITEANTKYFFPEYFDESLSLGTTRSTVRLPGTVSYGVDLSALSPEAVTLDADSVVVITISDIAISSVEPRLEEMMVQTEVGWARTSARSGRTVERRAVIAAQHALREEAVQHLQRSPTPLLTTEAAFQTMLAPVLAAAGITDPHVRIRIAPTIVEQE